MFSVQLNRERDQFLSEAIQRPDDFFRLPRTGLGTSGGVVPQLALVDPGDILEGGEREDVLIMREQALDIKFVRQHKVIGREDFRKRLPVSLGAVDIKADAFKDIILETGEIAFVSDHPPGHKVARRAISFRCL